MTYIISAAKPAKKIKINPSKNSQIRNLHRKLVALSFSQGNHTEEYLNTLNEIKQLRQSLK